MALESLVSYSPLAVALAIGLPVAGKVILAVVLAKDADPKDRSTIIKAVAELFGSRRQ